MATRLYLSSSQSAPIEPAVDAAWAPMVPPPNRCLLLHGGPDGSVVGGVDKDTVQTGVHNLCVLQGVSAPLAAQSISGTVKGQVQAAQNDPDQDSRSQMVIRVVSPSGVVRGTLLAAHSEALSSEWILTFENRKFPLAALSPATLSAVTAQDGDHLVVEWGARTSDPAERNEQISVTVGAPAATADLPENETESGALLPWIEFSADLSFVEGGGEGTPHSPLRLGLGL